MSARYPWAIGEEVVVSVDYGAGDVRVPAIISAYVSNGVWVYVDRHEAPGELRRIRVAHWRISRQP